MRVLFITNMYPTVESPAIGIFIEMQYDLLMKHGINIELFTIPPGGHKFKYIKSIYKLKSILKYRSYDLLHIHYGLSGISTLLNRSIPLIATYYGSDIMLPTQRWISSWLSRRTVLNIVMNERMANILGRSNTVIQPLPIQEPFYKTHNSENNISNIKYERGNKYILFPSNPQRTIKRYDIFLSVVAELRKVIGDCDILTLPGDMSTDKVIEVYHEADLMLLCSDHEGSPQCVKEALACGLPLVAFDVGDVAMIVQGIHNCAVVHHGDVDSMVDLAIGILRDGKRVDGITRLNELNLTPEAFAKQMIEYYHMVIGR